MPPHKKSSPLLSRPQFKKNLHTARANQKQQQFLNYKTRNFFICNPNNQTPLTRLLLTGLRYVKTTCVMGASNKKADLKRTGFYLNHLEKRVNPGNYVFNEAEKTWEYRVHQEREDIQVYCRMPRPRYNNPIYDPRFNLSIAHAAILFDAIRAIETRTGVCHFQSCLLIKYLWEKHKGLIWKIDLMYMRGFDHAIVVINRRGNNLKDYRTWGDDCWLLDPWYGENGIYAHVRDFEKVIYKILKFRCNESSSFSLSHIDELKFESQCEILPKFHLYPTYSTDPFYPIECYYYLGDFVIEAEDYHDDEYPEQGFNVVDAKEVSPIYEDYLIHQDNFTKCLDDIEQFDRNKLRKI